MAGLYAARLEASLTRAGFRVVTFTYPGGEHCKTLATYTALLDFLAAHRLSRSDLIVALGGGVTGDLAGFAAATYQRGIPFVQVPTTLLAAVDSSVGGKTAVNLDSGKNQVGCFYQPSLVLCDPDTLRTLPPEEYRNGCAEVIKYAVLRSAPFFDELRAQPVSAQVGHVIATCVGMKRDLVVADEFDRGSRQLLNLGHTFGHAVEACSGYTVPHGCGVAIGMAHHRARRRQTRHLYGRYLRADPRAPAAVRPADGDGLLPRCARGCRALGQKDRRRQAAPHRAGAHRLLPHRDGPGGGHPRMARGRRHRMNQTVCPGARTGSVRIPASKSQAHRLLICAALGAQPVTLRCDGISADIAATVRCLRALGADITDDGAGTLRVVPIAGEMPEHADLFCGESGSTLRFLLPVAGRSAQT